MTNINNKNNLFVCSGNQWRSPTAERVWREQFQFETRSAGTNKSAKHVVSHTDIQWADVILCMEEKHKSRLIATFRQLLKFKEIIVLDIPDNYKYMDTELVEIFTELGQSRAEKSD